MPSLSPRQPSPGNAKKRTSRSSVKNQQRIKPKSPPYWRAFGLVRPNRLPKKTVSSRFMPNQRRPEDRHSRIPRSVASRRTRHKEGTTRLPILRLRVRAKRVAATKKEPATSHESEAAQRPERGRTPSGHVLRHRKTRPLNASHEPFPAPLEDDGGRSARRKRRRPRAVSSSRVARFREGGGSLRGEETPFYAQAKRGFLPPQANNTPPHSTTAKTKKPLALGAARGFRAIFGSGLLSHMTLCSIIGDGELNFRVRNGVGCTLSSMATKEISGIF